MVVFKLRNRFVFIWGDFSVLWVVLLIYSSVCKFIRLLGEVGDILSVMGRF